MWNKFFHLEKNFQITLATGALLMLGIPVGIACLYLGGVVGESPCYMCWDERSGMIFLGALMLFMVRYGLRRKYLAMYAFWCFFGLYMSMRHTGNHIWRDMDQGFGNAIFGVHTYAWAIFVYWMAVISIALIVLFLQKGSEVSHDLATGVDTAKPMSRYSNFIAGLCVIVTGLNVVQAFFEFGPPPFLGNGRQVRTTLDITKSSQNWTTYIWKNVFKASSLRGFWTAEKPWIAGENEHVSIAMNDDPAAGPAVLNPTTLRLKATYHLPFEPVGFFGKGAVAGFDWNETLQKFAFITTNTGIYYTDAELSKVTDKAILDYPNGNDLVKIVDAAFMGDRLIGMGYNKTFFASALKDPQTVKDYDWWQWRTFLEATPGMVPDEKLKWVRPFLMTSRAKFTFVGSTAFNKDANELYLVTVPNERTKQSILLTFDGTDNQVLSERVLKPAAQLSLKDKRTVADYYVTGLTRLTDGKLLALSRNYRSLLVIDPKKALIESVYGLPSDVADPHSLTIAQGDLLMLGRKDGKDVVYRIEFPR